MNLTISAGHNVAFMIQRLGWPWSMLDSEEFQKVERQFIISTTAARSDTFPSYHQYNKWCRRRHNIRHLQFREQCPLCGEQFHLTDGHLARESVSGQNWLVFHNQKSTYEFLQRPTLFMYTMNLPGWHRPGIFSWLWNLGLRLWHFLACWRRWHSESVISDRTLMSLSRKVDEGN